MESADGTFSGSTEHVRLLEELTGLGQVLQHHLTRILLVEPQLNLRHDALRLAYLADVRGISSTLRRLVDRRLDQLIHPRARMLMELWELLPESDPDSKSAGLMRQVLKLHWFEIPRKNESGIHRLLRQMAQDGPKGLFHIRLLLGMVLDERWPVAPSRRPFFRFAAQLFTKHQYYEGIEPLFDFLDACRPRKPDADALAVIGEVLRATRSLRPYRNPEWARPLSRFASYFKSIGQVGRAAEANMVSILINSNEVEGALLLDDDELVDLLRGRRDAAYTLEELEQVAGLAEAVIKAGRRDARILHILGWLKGRLEGEEAARACFLEAIEIDPHYPSSLIALSSLCERQGDELGRDHYLETACKSPRSMISAHRRWANRLARDDELEAAAEWYRRGTEVIPEVAHDIELEDLFGCFVGLADTLRRLNRDEEAIAALEKGVAVSLDERFPPWFLYQRRIVIRLLTKGLADFKEEILRKSQAGQRGG